MGVDVVAEDKGEDAAWAGVGTVLRRKIRSKKGSDAWPALKNEWIRMAFWTLTGRLMDVVHSHPPPLILFPSIEDVLILSEKS